MYGKHLEDFIDRADVQKILSSEYLSHENTNMRRASVDKARVHNTLVDNEGVSYGAGEF